MNFTTIFVSKIIYFVLIIFYMLLSKFMYIYFIILKNILFALYLNVHI